MTSTQDCSIKAEKTIVLNPQHFLAICYKSIIMRFNFALYYQVNCSGLLTRVPLIYSNILEYLAVTCGNETVKQGLSHSAVTFMKLSSWH